MVHFTLYKFVHFYNVTFSHFTTWHTVQVTHMKLQININVHRTYRTYYIVFSRINMNYLTQRSVLPCSLFNKYYINKSPIFKFQHFVVYFFQSTRVGMYSLVSWLHLFPFRLICHFWLVEIFKVVHFVLVSLTESGRVFKALKSLQ